MGDTLIFGKDVKRNPKNSKFLKEMKISEVLGTPIERKEFNDKILEKTGGPGHELSKTEMKEVLGYFHENHGERVSSKEASQLAKKIFPKVLGSPYISEKKKIDIAREKVVSGKTKPFFSPRAAAKGIISSRNSFQKKKFSLNSNNQPAKNIETGSSISNKGEKVSPPSARPQSSFLRF